MKRLFSSNCPDTIRVEKNGEKNHPLLHYVAHFHKRFPSNANSKLQQSGIASYLKSVDAKLTYESSKHSFHVRRQIVSEKTLIHGIICRCDPCGSHDDLKGRSFKL